MSEYIYNMILNKKRNLPFYANEKDITKSITDMDHFPYTRFYRGEYNNPNPVIFNRKPGWRPLNNECYAPKNIIKDEKYPHHCFQEPCSSVGLCIPKNNVDVNKCIVMS